jgi:hypothetical protein
MLTSSENLPLGKRANCTSISQASSGSLILHVSHASQDGTRRNNPSEPTRSTPPGDFLQNVTGSALPLPNKGRLCCDDVKAECCWSVISQASESPTLAPKMDPSITATTTAVVCPQLLEWNAIVSASLSRCPIEDGQSKCDSRHDFSMTPTTNSAALSPNSSPPTPSATTIRHDRPSSRSVTRSSVHWPHGICLVAYLILVVILWDLHFPRSRVARESSWAALGSTK